MFTIFKQLLNGSLFCHESKGQNYHFVPVVKVTDKNQNIGLIQSIELDIHQLLT